MQQAIALICDHWTTTGETWTPLDLAIQITGKI
jgi:hypothetical protein